MDNNTSRLISAVFDNIPEQVKATIDGVSLSDRESMLFTAIRMNRVQVVKVLLADPRIIRREEAFNIVLQNGTIDMIKVFLDDPRLNFTKVTLVIKLLDYEYSRSCSRKSKSSYKITQLMLNRFRFEIDTKWYVMTMSKFNKETKEILVKHILNYHLIIKEFARTHLVVDLFRALL